MPLATTALLQFERSQEALRVLSSSEDAQGRRLQVVKLPLPPPQYRSAAEAPLEAPEQPQQGPGLPYHGQLSRRAGDRLAASYVNFYLPNGRLRGGVYVLLLIRCNVCPVPPCRARPACLPARHHQCEVGLALMARSVPNIASSWLAAVLLPGRRRRGGACLWMP